MQIIAGRYKGLSLVTPAGAHTRPTLSRIRESLFNILGYPLSGSFLELYAGSGSVGLEAFSRGSKPVILVENHRQALASLERNVKKIKASQAILQVISADALSYVRRHLGKQHFDVVFLDPPYEQTVFDQWAQTDFLARLLRPSGVVVVQHSRKMVLPPTWSGLERQEQRPYGLTVLSFYKSPVYKN